MPGYAKLSPPPGFQGDFLQGRDDTASFAASSGPVRLQPHAVARPRSTDDVAALVHEAQREGWSLIPRGAGTGMPGGNVGPGIVVDMWAFGGKPTIDTETRTALVGAGAVVADIQAAAQAEGLDMPVRPSSAPRCTIGGVLANNAAGARSFAHGSIRAWTVGLDAVLADGSLMGVDDATDPPPFPELLDHFGPHREAIVSRWPQVRKNSSGYALPSFLRSGRATDLLVGSEGTLAILTGARLRLRPAPTARFVAVSALRDIGDLDAFTAACRAEEATACEFFGPAFLRMAGLADDPRVGYLARGSWGLGLAEVDGPEWQVRDGRDRLSRALELAGLDTLVSDSSEDAERLWAVRHGASPMIARKAAEGLVSTQFIEDSVVPPTRLVEYLEGLDRILAEAGLEAVVFGHAGDANVHVNPLVDFGRADWRSNVRTVLERVTDLVRGLGGTLSGEHGDGRIRTPLNGRIWPADLMEHFRHVKRALDPSEILNPGVKVPLADQDPLHGLGPR